VSLYKKDINKVLNVFIQLLPRKLTIYIWVTQILKSHLKVNILLEKQFHLKFI